MAHQIVKRKQDLNKSSLEQSEFPILCETCLGENPFVRMTKETNGKECKVCTRPFTVFRWKPGPRARFKKTEICQVCSKSKNICQTCLLDLQYALPVQVRDHALPKKHQTPISDVNKEYQQEQIEKQLENGEITWDDVTPSHLLSKLARNQPYFKRNLPHICSFFVKGECNRGSECPFRHETPEENELSHQKIRDRFYGTNDPVALKLLNKVSSQLPTTDDPENSTLFVGNVVPPITEQDLRDKFKSYGDITGVQIVERSKCAFVTFGNQDQAEKALKALHLTLQIHKIPLSLSWGKQRPQSLAALPPDTMITMPNNNNNNWLPIPPPLVPPPQLYYPSMDPLAMGSKGDKELGGPLSNP